MRLWVDRVSLGHIANYFNSVHAYYRLVLNRDVLDTEGGYKDDKTLLLPSKSLQARKGDAHVTSKC